MILLNSLSVSVFACMFFTVRCGNARERFAVRREGFRLKSASTRENLNATSLTGCLSICSHIGWCKSVSFEYTTGICWMGADDITNDKHAKARLDEVGNWVSMSKVIYTVFMRWHPDGENKATFTDAVALCNEMNTKVAWWSDMKESEALGLQYYCSTGWFANQNKGYIHQDWNTKCIEALSVETLSDKANVWCLL